MEDNKKRVLNDEELELVTGGTGSNDKYSCRCKYCGLKGEFTKAQKEEHNKKCPNRPDDGTSCWVIPTIHIERDSKE